MRLYSMLFQFDANTLLDRGKENTIVIWVQTYTNIYGKVSVFLGWIQIAMIYLRNLLSISNSVVKPSHNIVKRRPYLYWHLSRLSNGVSWVGSFKNIRWYGHKYARGSGLVFQISTRSTQTNTEILFHIAVKVIKKTLTLQKDNLIRFKRTFETS
jgi:hypothetical protein